MTNEIKWNNPAKKLPKINQRVFYKVKTAKFNSHLHGEYKGNGLWYGGIWLGNDKIKEWRYV